LQLVIFQQDDKQCGVIDIDLVDELNRLDREGSPAALCSRRGNSVLRDQMGCSHRFEERV